MEELRCSSPVLKLDLNNFDSPGAESNRHVLTNPRSLESCARLGVKPVQLLIKSLNDFIAERQDTPFETMRVVHESYEKERLKTLQKCGQERLRIIQTAGDRLPCSSKASGLEVLPDTRLEERSTEMPYADLCSEKKAVSRSSCSAPSKRDPERSTLCSFNLGDLIHSPATEKKLKRLTKSIQKQMCVTVSERDQKIAALMLVKHEEEQARLKLSQQEEWERQEARRQEEAQQVQAEKKRRKKLKRSMKRWNEELEARRKLREHREKEKAERLKQEVLLQEDRWRRLKEEVEVYRRAKMEGTQKEVEERKRYQEKLLSEKEEAGKRERERERQVAAEKEEKVLRSKMLKEKGERKRLQKENHKELLRHILLKHQVELQGEEEEAQRRSTLEKKLQHSCERRAKSVEARLEELRERAAREEEMSQRVQLRAELQSVQQLTHKQILVQLSQRRMERAALHASAQHRRRAQQTRQNNKHRQLCHQRLREELQREEEAARRVRESCISTKEQKRERLRRQREQIQEEAQRLARASFHMRERVRQQTHSRTFDQMALEAQLTASLNRMNL
ncbi:coiled-coil domain-containing protein 177 [Neolamprologus brichardi]|uniref:coiled-coil domain-containing protein 177 n=1 Tax=Neolamprologus brichardi TaxID=32507 RepID=UPI0003EC007E|nr:coiled-coil domain-containing protein 177 [Neolamprologus brichardi]